MRTITLAVSLVVFSGAVAQAASPGWPVTVEREGYQVTVFPPQVEKLAGDALHARAAVTLTRDGTQEVTYGLARFGAKVSSSGESPDFALSAVSLDSIVWSTTQSAEAQERALRSSLEAWPSTLTREQALDTLAVTQAAPSAPDFAKSPTAIVYRDHPTALAQLDGAPKFAALGTSGFSRVLNTQAPLYRRDADASSS